MTDFSIVKNINNLLIKIPEGQIGLRDDRLKKIWKVDVKAFCLSKHQITQSEYLSIVAKGAFAFTGEKRPVENVSWVEAVHFCNKLSQIAKLQQCYTVSSNGISFQHSANGYRLPTEAEWEYSCRAGNNDIRYGDLNDIAWYKENSSRSTQNVGQKLPNKYGLHDMLGNVWEWCSDIYDEEVYGNYRILRGGGWFDDARGCIVTNRRRSHPTLKIDDLGFRIGKNI